MGEPPGEMACHCFLLLVPRVYRTVVGSEMAQREVRRGWDLTIAGEETVQGQGSREDSTFHMKL